MQVYQYGLEDITFQDAITTTSNGTALSVEGYRELRVDISNLTATATRTISFYGTGASGVLKSIIGYNCSVLTATATSTTGANEMWELDITGLHEVYMAITAISGDTVTITGRAVS